VDYWGLSIDRANRGHMLSLSLFDYTDDVMAARDRPIDFSDITRKLQPTTGLRRRLHDHVNCSVSTYARQTGLTVVLSGLARQKRSAAAVRDRPGHKQAFQRRATTAH